MTVWGKLFGTAAGIAAGGPVGGIVGFLLGARADNDKLLSSPAGWGKNFPSYGKADPQGATFFSAVKIAALFGKKEQLVGLASLVLSAKIAKIDGPVNNSEIEAFKNAINVPPEQLSAIAKAFDKARERTDDFERYAVEIGEAFKDNPQPLEPVLFLLFHIARADLEKNMPLHPAEKDFLKRVHKAFHLSETAWKRASLGILPPENNISDINAYRILGVPHEADLETIRIRWKVLMKKYHPDILQQKILTKEQEKTFRDRAQRINNAWDHIKKERNGHAS
ncbi:molecular chaperone DjiA [Acetobacteraceae bacterium]|nr:molecular chaperone DjiA [Acetobacteraceae bacterium]